MEIESQRKCLCLYLNTLVKEQDLCMDQLVKTTRLQENILQAILNGNISPTLDELLRITNALGRKVTITESVSFAQKKIEHQLELVK